MMIMLQCLPRCEGCGIFDRCFQYPRRELERDCGCQFALLHKADHQHQHGTPVNTYVRGPSVDNQSNVLEHMDSMDADTQAGQLEDLEPDEESQMMMAAAQGQKETEDQHLIQREREKDRDVAQPQRMLPLQICASKQRKFATQRSILKNSQERTYVEENEVLEAKKQLILRRRRLFSHYRQYDQWRRRQFSYDPSYFRPPPLLPRPLACAADYTAAASTMYSGTGAGIGASIGQSNHHAGRRRRQYRRQYSCADRSRDGSRESGGSSNLQLQATQKYHSMVASDTIHTDSSMLNHSNYSEPASVSYTKTAWRTDFSAAPTKEMPQHSFCVHSNNNNNNNYWCTPTTHSYTI
ncbi:uncharacterized protein Dwil_GK27848 [Drosophila willistoni]|uniref:Uncharacterized protein n=1 Tax=Drosophila willistoni TaxID=7260 RepID=A0A0Q9WS46_DROWI|nr:uncharacterized protein Dwil_GK27848 [Drosophila willistoni]